MHDADLRQALHRRLARQHRDDPDGTRILDEFGICGQVRVDVAVVNGALTGYELKSARDTLKRLPRQADYYSRVLDYAHIVVADTHAAHALQMVPSWWGCTIAATGADGRVELAVRRAGRENPGIDPDALALLLWRGEALAALEDRGLDRGYRSKTRLQITRRLAEALPLDELRGLVYHTLAVRPGWRSTPLPV